MKRYGFSQRDLGNDCPCCYNTHDLAYAKRGRSNARRSAKQEIEEALKEYLDHCWIDMDTTTEYELWVGTVQYAHSESVFPSEYGKQRRSPSRLG